MALVRELIRQERTRARARLPRRRDRRRLAVRGRRARPLHRRRGLDGAVRALPAVPQGGRVGPDPRRGAVGDGAQRTARRRGAEPALPADARDARLRPDRPEREPGPVPGPVRRRDARRLPRARPGRRVRPRAPGRRAAATSRSSRRSAGPTSASSRRRRRRSSSPSRRSSTRRCCAATPTARCCPASRVDAVVEVPYGAHPTSFFPAYGYDTAFHLEWVQVAARRRGGGGVPRPLRQGAGDPARLSRAAVGGASRLIELTR